MQTLWQSHSVPCTPASAAAAAASSKQQEWPVSAHAAMRTAAAASARFSSHTQHSSEREFMRGYAQRNRCERERTAASAAPLFLPSLVSLSALSFKALSTTWSRGRSGSSVFSPLSPLFLSSSLCTLLACAHTRSTAQQHFSSFLPHSHPDCTVEFGVVLVWVVSLACAWEVVYDANSLAITLCPLALLPAQQQQQQAASSRSGQSARTQPCAQQQQQVRASPHTHSTAASGSS